MSIATDMKVAELVRRVEALEKEVAQLRALNVPQGTVSTPKQTGRINGARN